MGLLTIRYRHCGLGRQLCQSNACHASMRAWGRSPVPVLKKKKQRAAGSTVISVPGKGERKMLGDYYSACVAQQVSSRFSERFDLKNPGEGAGAMP